MKRVILYSKDSCHLCEEVKSLLELLLESEGVEIKEVDIETDPALYEKYMLEIPVVKIGSHELHYPHIDYPTLSHYLDEWK